MSHPSIFFATELPEGLSEQLLQHVFQEVCSTLHWSPPGDVSVSFVDEKTSRQLNQQFAGHDYATDVLSFDYTEHQSAHVQGVLMGELIVCSSIAHKQAQQYNVGVTDELILLYVHGLLHLSGLDHQDSTTQSRFESIQSGIMKSFNRQSHSLS